MSKKPEIPSNDVAELYLPREGAEWEPLSHTITREHCNQYPCPGNAFFAYKFPNGDVWDSIVGWWNRLEPVQPFKTVFAEAEEIIFGNREETYGHPAKNLENIASQWKTYLHQKYGAMIMLDAEDVCWMMADLKKCRQMNSSKRDNLVDAIGYIGLISRCE